MTRPLCSRKCRCLGAAPPDPNLPCHPRGMARTAGPDGTRPQQQAAPQSWPQGLAPRVTKGPCVFPWPGFFRARRAGEEEGHDLADAALPPSDQRNPGLPARMRRVRTQGAPRWGGRGARRAGGLLDTLAAWLLLCHSHWSRAAGASRQSVQPGGKGHGPQEEARCHLLVLLPAPAARVLPTFPAAGLCAAHLPGSRPVCCPPSWPPS